MGAIIINAYAETYLDRQGKLKNTEFWDTAEIMEAMLDAYEQTGNTTYLTYAENIAIKHANAKNAKNTISTTVIIFLLFGLFFYFFTRNVGVYSF